MVTNSNKHFFEEIPPEYEKMLSSGIWYAAAYYKVLRHFQKSDLINRWVSSGAFFHGYLPEGCLSLVSDQRTPTGIRVNSFKIKSSVLPSWTLDRIEEGMSFLDCGILCSLSVYKALRDILTPEKFDYLFAHDSPYPFHLSGDHYSPLLHLLIKQRIDEEKEVRKGDICYFSNIKDYVAKHPVGISRGFQVICSQEKPHRYIGFGLGTLTESVEVDKTQIECELWDDFNEAPIDEGFHSQTIWKYLHSFYFNGDYKKGKQLVDSYRDRQISWEHFQMEPPRIQVLGMPSVGKMSLWVYRPSRERIQLLVDAPLNRVREVFASFLQL
jgi:hypothetical protein